MSSKRLAGTMSAMNRSAYYVPDLFTKSQIEYVNNFMSSNGYLDLEVMSRLGIADPMAFVEQRFSSQELVFLKTTVVGAALFSTVTANS